MSEAQSTHQHHHHHHHHSSRRKHFLRKAMRDSVLLALTIVAALCVCLVMYCGIKDKPNLLSLLTLAMPAFLFIGAVVGLGNWLFARRNYDRDRN